MVFLNYITIEDAFIPDVNSSGDEINTKEGCPKEWETPYDDSPLSLEAFKMFGHLGSFVSYKIKEADIDMNASSLHELLSNVLNSYMKVCTLFSVFSDLL